MDISLLCGAGYIWISGEGKEIILRIAFGSPGRKAFLTGFSWQRTFSSMYSVEKAVPDAALHDLQPELYVCNPSCTDINICPV